MAAPRENLGRCIVPHLVPAGAWRRIVLPLRMSYASSTIRNAHLSNGKGIPDRFCPVRRRTTFRSDKRSFPITGRPSGGREGRPPEEPTEVTHSNHDGVAVLLIDNPPVNALGPQAVAPVLAALEAAQADDAVTALVLAGANGTFSGGADMKGFGISPPPRPNARDLIDALEASAKPVVAAVDGVAMGGGLEVALACDYRVAAPAARLGLPEITRGLLPGAGGTQRLPRLIGVRAALEIILGGEPAGAERAREIGLVDAVEADPCAAAVALARTLTGKPRRQISATAAQPDGAALAAARERAQPEARGGLAEQRAIACVADAVELPFAEGLARERE